MNNTMNNNFDDIKGKVEMLKTIKEGQPVLKTFEDLINFGIIYIGMQGEFSLDQSPEEIKDNLTAAYDDIQMYKLIKAFKDIMFFTMNERPMALSFMYSEITGDEEVFHSAASKEDIHDKVRKAVESGHASTLVDECGGSGIAALMYFGELRENNYTDELPTVLINDPCMLYAKIAYLQLAILQFSAIVTCEEQMEKVKALDSDGLYLMMTPKLSKAEEVRMVASEEMVPFLMTAMYVN